MGHSGDHHSGDWYDSGSMDHSGYHSGGWYDSGSMGHSGDHHSGDWYDSGSMGHSGDQDSVSAPQTLEQYISVMSPPLPNFPYYSDEPNCAAACGTSGYSSTTVPQVETVWTGQWVMETSEAGSVCSGASPDGVTNISSLLVRSDECAPLICLTITNEYDGEQIRTSAIQFP